jgi:hypothetical protein
MPTIRPIKAILEHLNTGLKAVAIPRWEVMALPRGNLMPAYRELLESRGISHDKKHPGYRDVECCVSTVWVKESLLVTQFYREWRKASR